MEVSRTDLAFSAVRRRYHIMPPSVQPDLRPLPQRSPLLGLEPSGKQLRIPARLGEGYSQIGNRKAQMTAIQRRFSRV